LRFVDGAEWCRRYGGRTFHRLCGNTFLNAFVRGRSSAADLYQLKLRRESEPEAPEGDWYKDVGSFKICGDGEYPKTFLLRGQPARGRKL